MTYIRRWGTIYLRTCLQVKPRIIFYNFWNIFQHHVYNIPVVLSVQRGRRWWVTRTHHTAPHRARVAVRLTHRQRRLQDQGDPRRHRC